MSQQFEKANREPPGLLLLDALGRPLYVNEEAVSIVFYPESPSHNKRFGDLLVDRVCSLFPKQNSSLRSQFPREFVSGKRRYHVQAFTLKSCLNNHMAPTLGLLLVRNSRTSLDLSRISQIFHLTQRETEVLALLMQGCTTRQIASRMCISPNTAKTYLSLITSKIGVSRRSGLLARILQLSTRVTL